MRVVPVHAHQLLMTAALHDATLLDHDDLARHPPPPGANEMPGATGVWGVWSRARLPAADRQGHAEARYGNYFHGQIGGDGRTHGCLTYGQDTTMIEYLWNQTGQVPVSVDGIVKDP